jgi:feruloyl esterase
MWIANATLKDPDSHIPREKFATIHKAAIDACDASDGAVDGMIENPMRCSFDPKVLECKGADESSCLTAPQVEAVRKIYSPLIHPRTKQEIYPGFERGSELGWQTAAGGPRPFSIPDDHFKFVVFKNPEWDFQTFDAEKDVDLADKLDNGVLNATNPDLKKFTAHGGKLILYHGWNDNLIAPRNTLNYYSSVQKTLTPARTAESVRLFMVPGMGHCGGGDGLTTFEAFDALDQWVEKGNAPEQVIATRNSVGRVDRNRPVCAYPKIAKYKGSGSVDDAANFTCMVP